MQNLWEVVEELVNKSSMSDDEKRQAHELIHTHLAQHQGIAAQLGVHEDKIGKHEEALKKLSDG